MFVVLHKDCRHCSVQLSVDSKRVLLLTNALCIKITLLCCASLIIMDNYKTIALLGCLFCFPGIQDAQQQSPSLQPANIETDATVGSFWRAFNYFDLDLLEQFSKFRGNVFISPASIKTTLALILEGARGKCAQELGTVLGIKDINHKDIRETLKTLLHVLADKSANTVLETQNAVFVSNKFTIVPEFQQKAQTYYKALVQNLDFTNANIAAKHINNWVNNATHGFIKEIVNNQNLFADSTLLLANAMFFKSVWKTAFDIKNTKIKCFNTPTGCLNTPMMLVVETFNYNFNTDLHSHVVEIPYQDDLYSMLVLVPAEGTDTDMVIRDLTHIRFNSVTDQLKPTEVILELPRFNIDFNVDLSKFLKSLKIVEIFNSNANLSGIVEQEMMRISNIAHKTKLEVNEQGTRAAAATTAIVIPLIGTSSQRVTADRPFVFFIYHKLTKTIIFEGIFQEPSSSDSFRSRSPPSQSQFQRSSNRVNNNREYSNHYY